jgi:hypothetical protein
MRPPSARFLAFLAVAAFVGGCAGGGCVAAVLAPLERPPEYARLPHSVAPTPDAAAFRFAMVHDVIHERYPRHGEAYYQARERSARERLAVLHAESVTALALTDDLAVALDGTGRTDEAVVLMRDKLKRQEAIGQSGKDLYSTYANLGEFLVHANLWPMLAGDPAARERLHEGLEFLRQSVRVNATAHFGREEWQVLAVSFLLEAAARPELLQECDLIGNRLDRPAVIRSVPLSPYGVAEPHLDVGRPNLPDWGMRVQGTGWDLGAGGHELDAKTREAIREYITPVGAEPPPKDSGADVHGRRAPFDEPALWIVGEWRQGSGPSSHLALCLGEIMLRVGQRYVAWSCYERASRMADQFFPRAELHQFLRAHCQDRQSAIEKSLPPGEIAGLRPKFDAELAFGEAYQRDYQAYAEQKIQAGGNGDDPHFFDAFHAGRPPIASQVGPEEWYAGSGRGFGFQGKYRAFRDWGLLSGGAAILLLALFLRWCYRRCPLRLTEVTPPPSPAGESPPASSDQSR